MAADGGAEREQAAAVYVPGVPDCYNTLGCAMLCRSIDNSDFAPFSLCATQEIFLGVKGGIFNVVLRFTFPAISALCADCSSGDV